MSYLKGGLWIFWALAVFQSLFAAGYIAAEKYDQAVSTGAFILVCVLFAVVCRRSHLGYQRSLEELRQLYQEHQEKTEEYIADIVQRNVNLTVRLSEELEKAR